MVRLDLLMVRSDNKLIVPETSNTIVRFAALTASRTLPKPELARLVTW